MKRLLTHAAWLFAVLLWVSGVHAQQVSQYGFAATSGTYTTITGTTVTTSATDDGVFNGIPIGFTFTFNGVAYTQVNVSTNGWMTLGTATTPNNVAAVATNSLSTTTGTTIRPIIAPLWDDLEVPAGGLSYTTTGTAPNRIITIQYSNVEWNYLANAPVIDFQVRLFETSNVVEFIYSQGPNPYTFGTNNTGGASIGLSNGTGTGNFLSLDNTSANPTPSSTTETSNITTKPATGQVYRFTPPPPCTAPVDQATALTQGTTTIGQIDGSFTAAASAPSGYIVVRYLSGTTPTAPVNGVIYTAGNALGAGQIVQSGTTTTFSTSGLAGGTAYDFYVYSYNTGTTCSGPTYNVAAPLTATFSTSSCGGGLPAGTYLVGVSSPFFGTLTQALNFINTNGVTGPVILELEGSGGYSSAGETFPLVLRGNACVSATNNITIRPAAGASAISITSANAIATMSIDSGGRFFVIDGRAGGVGTIQDLTIENTNTGGVALRFLNEAMKNQITYCNIQGINNANTGGVVQFGTTTGANGNDSNAITFCSIHGTSAGTPVTLIYSSGSTGNTAQYNNNDTVANCNLYDFFIASGESNGFKLGNGNGGNANWAILNNSFYQTVTRTITGASTQYPMNLNCPNASGYVITGNYMGGTAPLCGGTPYTVNGAGNSQFLGAYINLLATGPQTIFDNNILANFNWSTTTTTANTAAPGTWGGLRIENGNISATNNTIGSTSGSSISVTTQANGSVFGIFSNANQANTYNITGNTISGITTSTTATTASNSIIGISAANGAATTVLNISGNTIGGTLANSFNASAISTAAQLVRGIQVTGGSQRANITGNTVRNLTNASAATGTTIAQTAGIYTISGIDSVAGNTVSLLRNDAQQIGLNTSAAVVGISQSSGTAPSSVIRNTVSSLTSGAIAGGANVIGINYSSATTGANQVSANLVHSLTAANAIATPGNFLIGISVTGGAGSIQNNMVRVGIDDAGNSITGGFGVYGIYETGGTSNHYHNSVYVGGAGVAANTVTSGFFSTVTSGTRSILNNIFYNARSNASGTAANYGIRIGATAGLTSNGNVVFAPGTGGNFGAVGATNYATLLAWQQATTQDGQSISANPQFIAPTANSAGVNLHISATTPTPVESSGVTVASVTDDFDGQTRAGLTPVDIGADAGNFIFLDLSAPVITYTALTNTFSTTNPTISATITDVSGVASGSVAPRVYYKKNAAGTYVSAAGTLSSGSAQNGTYSFTINYAAVGGVVPSDSIYYFIIAQDIAATPNVGSNPAGAVASDVNTVTTPPTTPNAYRILGALSGTVTVGATGATYPSLTGVGGLFEQLNLNGLSSDLTATIISDITETGTNALNAITQVGGTYRLTVVPDAATVRTVSGSLGTSTGLIRLSGARNVKFDGSFGGSGRYLRFRNNNNGGATMSFLNDSKRDTIANCIVEGANTVNGNILFGVSVTTGNDSNVVSGNLIRDTGSVAGFFTNTGVSCSDASAAAANSENIISNNEFVNCRYNALNLNATATGNNWQITGNAIYFTSPIVVTGNDLIQVQNGGGHLISNNDIGGSAPNRSGTVMSNTAGGTLNIIRLANTLTPVITSVVSNNRISNITTTGVINGITIVSGNARVLSNVIGGTQAYDTIRSAGSARTSGILLSGGSDTVSDNTVSNIRSTNTGTGSTTGVFGLSIGGGTNHLVSGNVISNIQSLATGTTTYFVGGIVASSGTGSTYLRNRIFNIGSIGTGAGTSSPLVYGMYLTGTSAERVFNNQISLGTNATVQARVWGIQDAGTAGSLHAFYNNSVYVSGTTTATSNSYAFQRTSTATDTLRNNILYNGRTGGTGFNYAFGAGSATGYAPVTSNYNLLVVPDTARLLELVSTSTGVGAYNASFTTQPNANWMALSSVVTPTQLFVDPITTGNLNIVTSNPESWYANGKGLALPTVATDFNGNARSTAVFNGATDIGSNEFSTSTLPPSATPTAAPAVSTTNSYVFAGRTIARFTWGATGTPPTSLDVKYYTGVTAPNTGSFSSRFNAYYDIPATGGSGYTYTVDLSYDTSVLGTIPTSATVQLAKIDGGTPAVIPGSIANPVTGILSSGNTTPLTSFSIFTGVSNATPLSMANLEILAKAEGTANRIDWTVSRVAEGTRFSLERSTDGHEFLALANLMATKDVHYNHLDEQPLAGTTYYRVRASYANGSENFSKVVSVRRSTIGTFAISVSPNPVVSVARVAIAGDVPADARLIVTDVTGRQVLTQAAASGDMVVDMSGVPAGTYIFQYRASGRIESVKIVKQ